MGLWYTERLKVTRNFSGTLFEVGEIFRPSIFMNPQGDIPVIA